MNNKSFPQFYKILWFSLLKRVLQLCEKVALFKHFNYRVCHGLEKLREILFLSQF